ncbi:MAG: RNA polymerase factor sigma-54 [Chlamydiales bacterium]|nr:RNA polymerase factor sigma-54 [Chlamydiia bacterium]MCP5507958.1 RNA polymerase factor sigma-54 [Chlamydiales bacterium]
MAQTPSLRQVTGQSQNLKQLQRLIMSPEMQQAINLLQVPIMELAPMIELEVEQNPLLELSQDDQEKDQDLERLEESIEEKDQDQDANPDQEVEFNDDDFEVLKQLDDEYRDYFAETQSFVQQKTEEDHKLQTFMESSVVATESLFEHLMREAHEMFDDPKDLKAAELLVGNFDENGFIETPLKEIAFLNTIEEDRLEDVLDQIKKFDPPGVGAANLRESLLIQLARKGRKSTLAYQIVESHFEDLIHNKIGAIRQSLKCTSDQISQAVQNDIAQLDLHPGRWFSIDAVQQITPDLSIHDEDNELQVRVNNEFIPSLRLNSRYLRMLDDENLGDETKEFIKQKILSAKWLLRNLFQRSDTLTRIGETIAKIQHDYLSNPAGQLIPLTMKAVAEELELHESTIARAVANKYVDTDRGILPLRSFFTNGLETDTGKDVSSDSVKEMIKQVIDDENNAKPLSDQKISDMMKERGIHCARRTVAKYRIEMQIGNAQQRRKF